MARGIDTVRLAINVLWESPDLFDQLTAMKADAKADQRMEPGIIRPGKGGPWLFNVGPKGAEGHEWILDSGQLTMTIGNWIEPKQRPSVMARIASETLWTHGVEASVTWVVDLLEAAGGIVQCCKLSQVDPCVDLLVPEACWHENLRHQIVTRAVTEDPHYKHGKLTGISEGRGGIMCRLYDKPAEIAQKSKKFWMFDIWGIDMVPAGHKVIRVEYQVRREVIKELGINLFDDLIPKLPNLWATLTRKWLRVVDDAEKHHTHQKLEPWWEVAQRAVPQAQGAEPLVRTKAIKQDEKQLTQQLLGYLTSLVALQRQGKLIGKREVLDLESYWPEVQRALRRAEWDDEKFTKQVKRKQVKFLRHGENFAAGAGARPPVGVSSKRQNTSKRRPHGTL